MIQNIVKKVVVDRARLPYSSCVKYFGVANLRSGLTDNCAIPKVLANLNGPMEGGNLHTGPDRNAIGARHV